MHPTFLQNQDFLKVIMVTDNENIMNCTQAKDFLYCLNPSSISQATRYIRGMWNGPLYIFPFKGVESELSRCR